MTSIMVLQGSGSSRYAGGSLSAMPQGLREQAAEVVVRVVAFEASLAQRAAAAATPLVAEDDDDTQFTDHVVASCRREPSSRAMLRALGIAASLLLAWISLQII